MYEIKHLNATSSYFTLTGFSFFTTMMITANKTRAMPRPMATYIPICIASMGVPSSDLNSSARESVILELCKIEQAFKFQDWWERSKKYA